jgi:hypothetical protein
MLAMAFCTLRACHGSHWHLGTRDYDGILLML